MITYEFYVHEPFPDEDRLIGILPERRNSAERITYKSIMNLAKKLSLEDVRKGRVYFIRVEIVDSTKSLRSSRERMKFPPATF